MSAFKRRDFLKVSSLAALPLIASASMPLNSFGTKAVGLSKDSEAVYFINDGIFYRPEDFINKLQEINSTNAIERDSYGEGGAMEQLLKTWFPEELHEFRK